MPRLLVEKKGSNSARSVSGWMGSPSLPTYSISKPSCVTEGTQRRLSKMAPGSPLL